MNKNKEKKLNAIKSEIEEIKNFAFSNNANIDEHNIDERNDAVNFNNSSENTLTLTKIIKQDEKTNNNNELDYIKKELEALKSSITSNENLLKEILAKIK